MNINFGENLRRLRADRQLTQEQLGFELGVSPQAISRWETNGTLPDITMLLAAADFFDVTLDELMGRKKDFSVEEQTEFEEKYAPLCLDDKIALTRKTLEKYPNNDYLLFILSNLLNNKRIKTKNTKYNKEIFDLCEKINRISKNIGYIVNTHCIMARIYADTNQGEKAREIAIKLPSLYCSREFIMRAVSEGAEKISCCQFNALMLMDNINLELRRISTLICGSREKTEILNTANEMIVHLTGGGTGTYNLRLMENHLRIAEIYCGEKDSENIMKHLEMALSYAEKYELPHKYLPSDAAWLKDYETEYRQNDGNNTAFSTILDCVEGDKFDFIRSNEPFTVFIEKVRKYSLQSGKA